MSQHPRKPEDRPPGPNGYAGDVLRLPIIGDDAAQPAWTCLTCAAVVVETRQHDAWHRDLDRRSS